MAMHTGVSSSKVLILLGAGLTGSVILKSGQLSDVILQLQELINGVNESELSASKIDGAFLAAQIRQLAQEIRELSLSNPVTLFNGNSTSSGSYASYLVPAAALGAMGYCYMWWKGLSLSDIMFVTKQNMANAVAAVSKQLENVSEALTATRRHLTNRLENLDWKLEEQKKVSKLIVNDVDEVKSNLSQIGFDIQLIQQMVTGLEGKLELLEGKQDMTNSGIWYLCQIAGGIKEGLSARIFLDGGSRIEEPLKITHEENSLKGLQLIIESNDLNVMKQPVTSTKNDFGNIPVNNVSAVKTRIHRSYTVGLSLVARDVIGADS